MGLMSISDSPDTSAAGSAAGSGDGRPLGDLPAGRPLQTDFGDDRDYPRLGAVSFRHGTRTENQEKL